MVTQAPKRSAVLGAIAFTLSCIGLMIFVWTQFGGTLPFAARGYQIKALFPETGLLTPNADVRISGINVGKVKQVEPQGLESLVTMQIDPQYAPLAADTHAILRQKTLLGEGFIALSQGNRRGPSLAEDGSINPRNVEPTQQLDQVLGSFDQPTQRALQQLLFGASASLAGRGQDLNDALGNLDPAVTEMSAVVGVLNEQQGNVRGVVNNLGTVLTTLGDRSADVQSLVRAGDSVLSATAARDTGLRATVDALPPFLAQLRITLARLNTSLGLARPDFDALTPVAPLLRPALQDLVTLSGPAVRLLHQAPSLLRAADRALPAVQRFATAFKPAIDVLLPAAEQVVPIIDFIKLHPQEVTGAMGHLAAFLNPRAPASNGISHYLRATFGLSNETPFGQTQRPASNRHNAFLAPGELDNLAHGLLSSDCDNLGNNALSNILPLGSNVPCALQPRYPWPSTVSPTVTPGYYPHVTAARP